MFRRSTRSLCLLLALMMLLPLCPAFAQSADTADSSPAPTIRVHLKRLALTDRADLILDGVYTITTAGGIRFMLPRGSEVTVQIRDDRLYLFARGVSLCAGSALRFQQNASPTQASDGLRFARGGNRYPGDLVLTVSGGMLQPVLTLSVEDYLLGVVPYEMSDSFPLEALKAQAVCARTYALAHRNQNAAWDVVDTTNDQVFKGIDATALNAARAVRETAGVIGVYKGSLANCYYSASNGGQTELVENVWSGRGDWSYYAMNDDPYDLENPESVVLRAHLRKDGTRLPDAFLSILCSHLAPVMSRLGFEPDPAMLRVDSIESVALTETPLGGDSRYYSHMEITLRWSGRKRISATAAATPQVTNALSDDEEWSIFGDLPTPLPTPVGSPTHTPEPTFTPVPTPAPTPVYSDFIAAPEAHTLKLEIFPEVVRALKLSIANAGNELLTVTETDTEFTLESRRYGHGVGMSQRGAQWMASRYHKTFDEILAFYYPGMQLMVAPAGAPTLPTADPALQATPGPAATPTPRPTLMPVTQPLPEGAFLASVEGVADDSSLNLRSEPNMAGEILMRLYKHQQLIVLEVCEDENWVHVKTDTAEGYVMVSFLERVDP